MQTRRRVLFARLVCRAVSEWCRSNLTRRPMARTRSALTARTTAIDAPLRPQEAPKFPQKEEQKARRPRASRAKARMPWS